MSNVSEYYSSGDEYDREYAGMNPDIPFLIQLCKNHARGGKILNMCCGTLREGIQLARVGFDVKGVDITETMLETGKKKLTLEAAEVQNRVDVQSGDMRSVDVGVGEYDFALVAFNSFLHMSTQEDQLKALNNIHRHLKPSAHMIIDIFMPDVERLALGLGRRYWQEEKLMEDEENSTIIVRNLTSKYNPADQTVNVHYYFQEYELNEGKNLIRSWWNPLELRVIFPAEWRLLLNIANFTIVEEWGDYEQTPFKENPEKMLFLAQKS